MKTIKRWLKAWEKFKNGGSINNPVASPLSITDMMQKIETGKRKDTE